MLTLLKYFFGIICILVGLFALVTPLTPGAWLILVGMELLGLGFLLPKVIRDPWEKAKGTMWKWFQKKK